MCLVLPPYSDVLNPLYLGRSVWRCFCVMPSMVVDQLFTWPLGTLLLLGFEGVIITLRKLCIVPSKVCMQDLAPWVLLNEASSWAYLGGFSIQKLFGPWIYCDHLGLLQILVSLRKKYMLFETCWKCTQYILTSLFASCIVFNFIFLYVSNKMYFMDPYMWTCGKDEKFHPNLKSYISRQKDASIYVKDATT